MQNIVSGDSRSLSHTGKVHINLGTGNSLKQARIAVRAS